MQCCFHPLTGFSDCKGDALIIGVKAQAVRSFHPLTGFSDCKEKEFAQLLTTQKVSIPLRGLAIVKTVYMIMTFTNDHGSVSIPLRGLAIVKENSIIVQINGQDSFHPLTGFSDCKEEGNYPVGAIGLEFPSPYGV